MTWSGKRLGGWRRKERGGILCFVLLLVLCNGDGWVLLLPPAFWRGQSVRNLICKCTGQDECSALWDRAVVIDSHITHAMSLLNTGLCLTSEFTSHRLKIAPTEIDSCVQRSAVCGFRVGIHARIRESQGPRLQECSESWAAVHIQQNWPAARKSNSKTQHRRKSPLESTGTGCGEENQVPGNEHKWEALGQSKLVENLE